MLDPFLLGIGWPYISYIGSEACRCSILKCILYSLLFFPYCGLVVCKLESIYMSSSAYLGNISISATQHNTTLLTITKNAK